MTTEEEKDALNLRAARKALVSAQRNLQALDIDGIEDDQKKDYGYFFSAGSRASRAKLASAR